MSAPQNPPGRVFLALGFIATTAITSLVGYCSSERLAIQASVQAERISKINSFENTALALNPLLLHLNEQALANQDLETVKTAINGNILAQSGQVSVAYHVLDHEGQESARRYQTSLAAFSDALERFEGPENSGPYQQAVGNLLSDQENLLRAMRRSAGMRAAP